MVVEIGDPLASRGRDREILHPLLDVAGDTVGKERGVLLDEVCGGRVAELAIGADLLELREQGVRLLRIERIAELADEVRGQHEPRLEIGVITPLEAWREAGQLDRL